MTQVVPQSINVQSNEGFSLHATVFPATSPKAEVVLLHGFAEHSGRYTHFIQALNLAGVNVITYDHRGHGKSDGPRSYISSFDEYIDDLTIVVNHYKNSELPAFLMGHSMGSLIAATWLTRHQDHDFRGFISSSGALKVSDHISPFLQSISGLLAAIVPTLPTIRLEAAAISRDQSVVNAYENDPLVWRKGVRARLGHELLQASKQIQERCTSISLPILILHGTADRLTDPKGSQLLMEKAASSDKQLILSDGGYHELHNDSGKEEIIQQIIDWINQRI